MYLPTDFTIGKEITGLGYNKHVIYDSFTNGHNMYWEGKGALKAAKKYANEQGFKRVIILAKTIRTKDKIFDLI